MAKYVRTPIGTAKFTHLHAPDSKFGQNKYKVTLALTPEDAEPLIETMREVALDEFGPKKAKEVKLPYKVNEEGLVEVTFKSKRRPTLFDARGNVIKSVLRVGGGSRLMVAGTVDTYDTSKFGVTLYLNSVMIWELKTWGGNPFAEVADKDADVSAIEEAAAMSPPVPEAGDETDPNDDDEGDAPKDKSYDF